MMKMSKALSILPVAATLLLGLLTQGCALKPKPSELEALENLRKTPSATAAQKRAPALVKTADEQIKRSQEKWKSSDLEESVDAALMGQAKLKHAIALADQDAAKRRIAKAEDDLEDLNEEQQKVQKDLDAVNETIGLLHQTAQAREEQKAMEAQMEAEKKLASDKAETADKISAAELALKTADTVQAATYAKAEYAAAADTLARALSELQKQDFQSAQMSADIARKKAEQATSIAQPIYAEKAKGDENRARADALTREASSIAGVTVRRDARGMLQRIVLTIPAEQLFTKKQTVIEPSRESILDPVAEIMKKRDYQNYPVQIVGFADPRGSNSSLLAMTLARAQAVQTALMSRGVESKRIMASGQGGAEPVASGKDRNRNNRIEIVFLYQ